MAEYKTFMHWSSGKDACMALYQARQAGGYAIDRLLTTVNREHQRVTMHGLPIELLQAQAKAIGLSLDLVEMGQEASMEAYEQVMGQTYQQLADIGYTHTAFGDIFLEDLRTYREEMIANFGFKGVFPLWKQDTRSLLERFIADGFQAIVVCSNAGLLPEEFCGRLIDAEFLKDLPAEVDPCGENGEFHTFCFDGPIFKHPVPFHQGPNVYKTYPAPKNDDGTQGEPYGYWYCDLNPVPPE